MEQVTLLLYVKDAVYGKRFLRFLMGKHHPRLHLELVTEREKVEHRLGTNGQRLVILTDDEMVRGDEKKKKKVIYLSGEKKAAEDIIFQFQKAEAIYQELLLRLNFKSLENEGKPVETKKITGIYVVFSPAGGSETLFSVMLSQYLGQFGKCLYLSLSGFPVFYEEKFQREPEFVCRGLGELLFFLQDREFPQRQEEIRKKFGNGFMIPPAPHFRDILDSTAKEWQRLFDRLLEDCGYDCLVVETGQIFDEMFAVMERGERVFLVQPEGIFNQVRTAVFQRYCQMEKKENLARRMECVRLSSAGEWEREMTNQPLEEISQNPQNMEFVRQLLAGERGEKESDE